MSTHRPTEHNVLRYHETGTYHSVITNDATTAVTQCGQSIRLANGDGMESVPDDASDDDICRRCQSRSYDDETIRVSPEGDSV